MKPVEHFRYCPRCGHAGSQPVEGEPFRCGACAFVLYFGPTVAAAAFLLDAAGRALFIRRAKDPARGKLALPGGFVDAGETAEVGVRREILEEVNLMPHDLRYLCSQVNTYVYQEVTYPVVDLFFAGRVDRPEEAAALDGVESFAWREPSEVPFEEIAFPSIQAAFRVFLQELQQK